MNPSLSRFIKLWTHPDYPADSVNIEHIELAESKLNSCFPDDYKEAIQQIGVFSTTIDLLDKIVDGDHDIHGLNELFSMEDVIDQTMAWREIGLPQNLIAIGNDDLGNKFCIQASESNICTNSNIYFWDHDFDEVERVASSFNEWIEIFNKLID